MRRVASLLTGLRIARMVEGENRQDTFRGLCRKRFSPSTIRAFSCAERNADSVRTTAAKSWTEYERFTAEAQRERGGARGSWSASTTSRSLSQREPCVLVLTQLLLRSRPETRVRVPAPCSSQRRVMPDFHDLTLQLVRVRFEPHACFVEAHGLAKLFVAG